MKLWMGLHTLQDWLLRAAVTLRCCRRVSSGASADWGPIFGELKKKKKKLVLSELHKRFQL